MDIPSTKYTTRHMVSSSHLENVEQVEGNYPSSSEGLSSLDFMQSCLINIDN